MRAAGGKSMGGRSDQGTSVCARLFLLGFVLLAVGASLVGGVEIASAASPAISFSPTTPAGPPPATDPVFVSGSGFKADSQGALFECSTDPSQPTIDVTITPGTVPQDLGQIPVSCSAPAAYKTTSSGKLPSSAFFSISSGALGPPAVGTDSAGGSAATDAKAYPCPPTAAQTSDTCELMFVDAAGQSATAPITFTFQSTTTTTTTATTSTTAPTGSTSTTAPTQSAQSTTTVATQSAQSTTTVATAAAQSAQSTTTVATASTTSASSGSLAFTGLGTGPFITGLVGVIFVLIGILLLILVDTPRRMLHAAARRLGRSPFDKAELPR